MELQFLKNQRPWHYFQEISKIPRGSGNMEGISSYIAGEGKRLGHEVFTDQAHNVLIRAKATAGMEKFPTVILQGHMDMVAAKAPDSDHDFQKDPLKLIYDEKTNCVHADKTTLGSDDGGGISYMLAILSDETVAHPELECIFTADEETGLQGAFQFDMSLCHGHYLVNLDGGAEGIFIVSSAGGRRVDTAFPFETENVTGIHYHLTVASNAGGHSGEDIFRERPNSNIVTGNILSDIFKDHPDFHLIRIDGGQFDNAIPSYTESEFIVSSEIDFPAIKKCYFEEYGDRNVELQLTLKKMSENNTVPAMKTDVSNVVLFYLQHVPNGVQTMSHAIKGLVETSLNLGIVATEANEIRFCFLIRSSFDHKKERLAESLRSLGEFLGMTVRFRGDYPGWAYRQESKLRDLCVSTWEAFSPQIPAQVKAIHAGLECGLFIGHGDNIDAISIGPNTLLIHTENEKLDMASFDRFYDYVLEILKHADRLS